MRYVPSCKGPLQHAPYCTSQDVASNSRTLAKIAEQPHLSYIDALQRTRCDSIEAIVRTRRLLWLGALLGMDDRKLPKRIMSGELKHVGQCGLGKKGDECTDYVAENRRVFGTTGD